MADRQKLKTKMVETDEQRARNGEEPVEPAPEAEVEEAKEEEAE